MRHSGTRKKLVVFDAPGVTSGELVKTLSESFNGAVIHKSDSQNLHDPITLNEDTLAFFLPGIVGEDSPYSSLIGDIGNKEIREYVEQGGVFVGICAGAYYACRDIIFDPPWRAEPKTSRPGLDFFNGLAKGPIRGYEKQDHTYWFSDCTSAPVLYAQDTKKTVLAYGNGPALYPYEANLKLEIIARYENVPGQPIAIAAQKIGKGLAIFIGTLPYIGYNQKYETWGNSQLQTLMTALAPHEAGRRDIWADIVSRIKHHNADLGRVTLLDRTQKSRGPA